MINFKEGRIWQKLKELTKEPGQKEVIKNLVVKEEEELNKPGKNNPLITFFYYFKLFSPILTSHHFDNNYILFFIDYLIGEIYEWSQSTRIFKCIVFGFR